MFSPAVVPPADALQFPLDLRAEQRSLLAHTLTACLLWLAFALVSRAGRLPPEMYLVPLSMYSALACFWLVSAIGARRKPAQIALTSTDLFVPTLRRWTGMRRLPLTALRRIHWMQ